MNANKSLIVVFFACATAMSFIVLNQDPKVPIPSNNPLTKDKIELGKLLFFDTRFSISNNKSCGSCHSPDLAFTDGYKRSLGAEGYNVKHNAPGLQNIAFTKNLTYLDSNVSSLEHQMLKPFFNEEPRELGLKNIEAQVLVKLEKDERLLSLFKRAFPYELNPINFNNIIQAIACYERTLVSFQSPYDQFVFGNKKALSPSAKRGKDLFFSARLGCSDCHHGLNLGANEIYYNNGATSDTLNYRVPSLRNVSLTSPYMHNGSINTLSEVLAYYENAGQKKPKNNSIYFLKKFRLDPKEKIDLLSFLYSLSDSSFINKHKNDGTIYE